MDQAWAKPTPVLMSSDVRAILGDAIKRRRAHLGFTQEGFAHFAGLARTYYGRIERGEQNVSLTKLCWIAARLQTSVPELTEGLTATVCTAFADSNNDAAE